MEQRISKNQNEPTLTAADIALLKESFVTNEQFRAFENRFTATHENFEKQLTRMDEKFEKRFAETDENFEKRFTAIHERIDAFENRMDNHMLAIGQTFARHEERFEHVESKIDILSGDIRLMHSSIKNLTASVQGFIMHVGRQEHQLNHLVKRVDFLENKIA